MGENAGVILNAAGQGHAAGWSKAQAELPALEINELIALISSVLEAKDNRAGAALSAAKQLASKYKKPMEAYLNAFSVAFIQDGLRQVKFGSISELGTEQFAEKVVDAAKNVESAVAAFCHSEIDAVELITELSQTGVLEVGQSFIQAAGIDLAEVKEKIKTALPDVNSASVLLISFCASAAAYKILREAMQDAAVMHENRLRIEAECARSVEMMRSYREQMNASVSDYLYLRAETFNAGVSAMDQAILDGDVNGFIRGNTMIQEILNYDIQFRNQDEFDALMDSDDSFKL